LKSTNQTAAIIKTVLVFVFGLFATAFKFILNFLFSDADTEQKTRDPLSHDPSLDWGDTHDDGWID